MSSLKFKIALVLAMALIGDAAPSNAQSNTGASPESENAEDSVIRLRIAGIRNSDGNIVIMVFNDPVAFKDFDYTGTAAMVQAQAQEGNMLVLLPGMNDGPYAITLFHDEDEDYNLDMIGDLPSEGFGTSGARDEDDDPSFHRATVSGNSVTVRMYYYRFR